MVRIEDIIEHALRQLETLRDALAAVSANSAIGQPASLAESAANLERLSRLAQRDCARVQRLMRHLSARTMPDAATTLCRGGRRAEARRMMVLHELTQGVSTAQAEVGLFIEECLNCLSATRTATTRQSSGGRLLGSA